MIVVFGQTSLEKPNENKLVQQMKVLLLCNNKNSKCNLWMPNWQSNPREILENITRRQIP